MEKQKSKKIPRVKESEANKCPHCNRTLEPNEGTSVMYEDGRCEITCPYCYGEYYYMEGEEC